MTQVYNNVLVTRNARDKIQTAQYILEQDGSIFIIKRFTGQYEGKITAQPEITITAGKVKRSVFQQAELEYNSLLKKATDKGYKKLSDLTKTKWSEITSEELDNIVPSTKTDTSGNIKPQLAKSSEDCSLSVWEKPRFASRKLDGVRSEFAYNKEDDRIFTVSRGGGDYDAATTAIRKDPQLLGFFRKNPDVILDGEIYVHGWSLQRISGTCRLKTFNPERCEPLEFWVFDIVDTEKTFNNRLDFLVDLMLEFEGNPFVKVLEHELVEGWAKVKKLHDKYVLEGFEGLVARHPDKKYAPGRRSSDWVKLKLYKDEEFEITGIEEGLRPEDMCFWLKTKQGKPFKAKPVGSRELRENYLEIWETLVGRMATVKFFIWSDDNVPMQPILKCIREEGE